MTASERVDDALAVIRAGAHGLVFKRFAIETLRSAIMAVAAGHAWMPPEIQSQVAARLREPESEPLTRREREVVRYVALGLRNAEIASRLLITEVTVKTHLNNIFHKQTVLQRILGNGEVGLETASETGMLEFCDVPRPLAFKNAIVQYREAYKALRGS